MIVIITNDENRIVRAALNGHLDDGEIEITLPKNVKFEDLLDYKYINNEFVLDPLPKPEPSLEPTQLDIIEAQVTYTAMMTDTLLEV